MQGGNNHACIYAPVTCTYKRGEEERAMCYCSCNCHGTSPPLSLGRPVNRSPSSLSCTTQTTWARGPRYKSCDFQVSQFHVCGGDNNGIKYITCQGIVGLVLGLGILALGLIGLMA